MFLEFVVVTLGCVVADEVDHDADTKGEDGGDDGDGTPRLFGITVVDDLEEGEQCGTHDELSDTTAKVSPSTDEGVSSADNFFGKHTRRPVLAHDEGSSSGSNEETEDGKAGSRVDESSTGGRDRCAAKDEGHGDTCTPLVAHGTKDETHEDGTTDTGDGRGPNFLLRETQVVTDFSEQGSNREPDEERDEET
mmetsp:Transcript_30137/g.73243  ORF Transcript_30137/g.73243 Transcript_30137/m.73243 type:complete len:193 (-) Transcript_30137:616-1194(-)